MLNKFLIFLLFLTLMHPAHSQDTSYIDRYSVGDTKIYVHSSQFHPVTPGVIFLNVHHNEETSVEAARNYLIENGGRLIQIKNDCERFLNFKINNKRYFFDPNRIFSDSGIASTLRLLSYTFDTSAARQVSDFAGQFLNNFIDSSQLIVALHNNRDSSLSVITYKNEHAGNKDCGDVFVNPDMDADDFILTTDPLIFTRVKEKNINVVLENANLVTDDGSLSVYAGLRNIPYINIEAQHDHSIEQCIMLSALSDIIEDHGKKAALRSTDERIATQQ